MTIFFLLLAALFSAVFIIFEPAPGLWIFVLALLVGALLSFVREFEPPPPPR